MLADARAAAAARRMQTRNVFNLVLGLIHADSRPHETEGVPAFVYERVSVPTSQ